MRSRSASESDSPITFTRPAEMENLAAYKRTGTTSACSAKNRRTGYPSKKVLESPRSSMFSTDNLRQLYLDRAKAEGCLMVRTPKANRPTIFAPSKPVADESQRRKLPRDKLGRGVTETLHPTSVANTILFAVLSALKRSASYRAIAASGAPTALRCRLRPNPAPRKQRAFDVSRATPHVFQGPGA